MRAVLAERFPDHGDPGRGVRPRPARGAAALGAGSDRRHARLRQRPTDLRHADRAAGRRDADPRGDRPAGDARALDRRGRAAHGVSRPAMAGARAAGRVPRWPMPNCPAPARRCWVPTMPRWQRLAARGAAQLLGRRLLCPWPAGARPDRRDRRDDDEAVGLGGAGAGGRGRRRPGHRLVRPAVAARTATGGCCRWAIRRCCRRSSRCLPSL